MSFWGNCITICIFVSECCLEMLQHNIHDIFHNLGAPYVDNLGLGLVIMSLGLTGSN